MIVVLYVCGEVRSIKWVGEGGESGRVELVERYREDS